MIDVRCHSSELYWKVEQTVGNKSVSNNPLWSLLQFLHLGSCLSFCCDFPQSWSVLWMYKPSNLFILPSWFAQCPIIAFCRRQTRSPLPATSHNRIFPALALRSRWLCGCIVSGHFGLFLCIVQFLTSFQITLPVFRSVPLFLILHSFSWGPGHLHSTTCACEQRSNQLRHGNEIVGHLCAVE